MTLGKKVQFAILQLGKNVVKKKKKEKVDIFQQKYCIFKLWVIKKKSPVFGGKQITILQKEIEILQQIFIFSKKNNNKRF